MKNLVNSLIVCALVLIAGCRYVDYRSNDATEYGTCATDANCDAGLICAFNAQNTELVCMAGCRNDAACNDPSKICAYDHDLGRDICQTGCRSDATCASDELCMNDSDLKYSICVKGCYRNTHFTTADETVTNPDGTTVHSVIVTEHLDVDSCQRNGDTTKECDETKDPYECVSKNLQQDGGVALDGGYTPPPPAVDGGAVLDGGYTPPTPAADGGAEAVDGGVNPPAPAADGGASPDGGYVPPAADGGANPDGGYVPPAADGGANPDGGYVPSAADGGANPDGGAGTPDAGYTPDAGVVLDGGTSGPDGGVTPIDGGTTIDGGVTVDGGVYTPTTSITAHICCPTGKEVILWWGNADAAHSPNSNGQPCGDFTMALAGDNNFCSRGAHPNTSATTLEGGWFSYNCRSGSDYGGWEQSTVTSVVNQTGSPMSYSTPFRATTSASNIAEVVVGNTCY